MTLLRKVLQSSIVKNLSILVSGTAIAQLIVIAFQVVLRRIYSPADFGAFAIYMSIVGILATISSFRYEQTILLPKKDVDAVRLLKLSALLSLLVSGFSFLVFIIFDKYLIDWINFPENYRNWFFAIPLSILIFSISQALNFYLIRKKKFTFSGTNKVVRRSGEGIAQFGLGVFNKAFGLFIGDLFGQLLVTTRTVLRNKSILKTRFSYKEYLFVAKQYKAFPLKNALPSLFNAFSLLLPVLILNKLFNEEITGYFDLARMVLIIPLSLVTASLSQVLLQRFTESRNIHKSIKKETIGTFLALLVFALTFGVIIQFFGKPLFEFVFGQQWVTSGQYASILVWAFVFKFIVSPFNICFTAFEKIGILSIWQILYFVLILLLYWLPFNTIEGFLYAYLVIELISYSFVGILDFVLIAKYEKSLSNLNLRDQ